MYFNNVCKYLLRQPTIDSGEVAKKSEKVQGEKGTAGGRTLSAFCSRRLLRATNRAISLEQ